MVGKGMVSVKLFLGEMRWRGLKNRRRDGNRKEKQGYEGSITEGGVGRR